MRRYLPLLLCAMAAPALAQPAGKVAEDVAMTPAEDVNLKKRQIPDVLISAQDDPYARESTRNCSQINAALGKLDAALGPDFDAGTPAQTGLNATKVAKSVVGSFIPFRGVVREISGAAGAERRYNAAVDAGIARRGFLRGIARARNCKLTARPITASS